MFRRLRTASRRDVVDSHTILIDSVPILDTLQRHLLSSVQQTLPNYRTK